MRLICKGLIVLYSLFLFGCGGENSEGGSAKDDVKLGNPVSEPDVVVPDANIPDVSESEEPDITIPEIPDTGALDFATPWIINRNENYLTENYVSYSPRTTVAQIDASIAYTESYEKLDNEGNKVYSFDDITFEAIGLNEYIVVNNTPDKISQLLINTSGYIEPVKLVINGFIAPFSRTRVVLQDNLNDISLINTSGMFLPEITLSGDITDQQGSQCTSECYSKPNAQQADVYGIITSNLHKAMNHQGFLTEMINFFRDDWCAVSGRNCNADIANIFYMRMGVKGHDLGLKVLSGPYSNDGSGIGEIPSLVEIASNSSGWASVWRNYITQGSPNWRPFASRTQETLFREIAYGYGFIDPFGMTEEGFSQTYASEFISSNKYLSGQEVTEVSELKPSAIVPVLVVARDKYLKFKLFKLEENADISSVRSRVITAERLARKDRFSVENNELFYEIELDELPQQAVVIQFYDSESGRVFTTREFANFYSKEGITTEGGSLTYFELPRIAIQGESYHNINATCNRYIPGSTGATKDQYQELWSSSDYNPELLNYRYFISSDKLFSTNISMLQMYYKVDMKNTNSFTLAFPVNEQGSISDEESILCVK